MLDVPQQHSLLSNLSLSLSHAGVVPHDSRVLQGILVYKNTQEEAGLCHESNEVENLSGECHNTSIYPMPTCFYHVVCGFTRAVFDSLP